MNAQVFSAGSGVDVLASETVEKIVKSINSSSIPKDANIAITFFQRIDGEKTTFGIRFTNKVAAYMKSANQKGKITQNILFPENVDKRIDESMYKYFTVPQGKNEGDYWAEFLDKQRPDFYVVGKYKFSEDSRKLTISEIDVVPDKYGSYTNISCVVAGEIEKKISEVAEINECKNLDIPVNKPNEYYEQLMELKDNPELFSVVFTNSETGKPVTDYNFVVEKPYEISINLKKDAYIYAFYYDPKDYNTQNMTMIYPYDKGQNVFFKAGTHVLPKLGFPFYVEPPFTPIYIKIFVLLKEIPIELDFIQVDGYSIASFSQANCKSFLDQLGKLSNNEVYSRSFNFSRSQK